MNDVHNLMGHLHTQMAYKEFEGGARPPADAWPILQRVGRMAPPVPAAAAVADVAAEPVEQAARPPLVRGLKRPQRSLLNRYAPADAAQPSQEDGRRLPLAEVFARLAAGR